MNVDKTYISEFIKKNYPKVIFEPVKFQYKNAIGFIISDNNLIIGFINKNGDLCKLIEPIKLSDISNDTIDNIIEKIPIVTGFSETDKKNLLKIFKKTDETISKKEHEQIVKELESKLKSQQEDLDYKMLYDSQNNQLITIQKEHEEQVKKLQEQFLEQQKQVEECKTMLIKKEGDVSQGIEEYKKQVDEYIKTKDLKIEELERLHQQMISEKQQIENKLNEVLQQQEQKLKQLEENKDLLTDSSIQIENKEKEIETLKTSIESIKNDLESLQNELNEANLKQTYYKNLKDQCKDRILNEKSEIIDRIKQYNEQWNDWAITIETNFEDYRKKLINELQIIKTNLDNVLLRRQFGTEEYAKLKHNIDDIKAELEKTIADQLIQLNAKDEQIKMLEEAGIKLKVEASERLLTELSEKDNLLNESQNQINNLQVSIKDKDEIISQLKADLEEVRRLLSQNEKTKIQMVIDYDNCFNILQNFFNLNNIFFRKQEIINRLDKILNENIGEFKNLNDDMKISIKQKFENVKSNIQKHIKFLDLEKYINSENFQLLKSKSTRNKVPGEFCTELTNILDYWNVNKVEYREQDRILTNIYEDLSGAVRVYIRIKPLIGAQQKENIVNIQTIDDKKQKFIVLDCSNVPNIKHNIKQTFGEFYGIFPDTFTNKNLYTGIEEEQIQPTQIGGGWEYQDDIEQLRKLEDALETAKVLGNTPYIKKLLPQIKQLKQKVDPYYEESENDEYDYKKMVSKEKEQLQKLQDILKTAQMLGDTTYVKKLTSQIEQLKQKIQTFYDDFEDEDEDEEHEEHEEDEDKQFERLENKYRGILPPIKQKGGEPTDLEYMEETLRTAERLGDTDYIRRIKAQIEKVKNMSYNNSISPNLKVNIDDIIESSETVHPGLYSAFKQVQDGYSIVLFGYGLSGSGKTFTLLGTKGVPGILHYGLANLENVKSIKLKYLFEQYYNLVNINFGKLTGKIHNLIREVPQLKSYSKNENDDFAKMIPSNIDVNNLQVNDLYQLTETIDIYRQSKNRIKKTPNNPMSSRSHLFFIFEITFEDGKTGYITIVDTAGRESPLEIYNIFIDSTKTKLASIMAPAPVGGEGLVEKTKKISLDISYTAQNIYQIFEEGFYINETINHMIYFFNKKNYTKTKVIMQSQDPEKYTVSKYYVNPTNEEQVINTSNNCLTIPILNFLDSLSSKSKQSNFKPTKFIMITCIRQEETYCDQTFESIEFAQSIKST
jgi:hypothetical protein